MTTPQPNAAPEARGPYSAGRLAPGIAAAVLVIALIVLAAFSSAGLALCLALGLATGQTFALFLDRFYTEEPLRGPAYACPSCRAQLTTAMALPLAGWALAGGRCPGCRQTLPLRAFVLPAGSAILFVLSYLLFPSLGGALLAGFFSTVFLALTLTDLERRVLPNRIVYPAVVLAAALAWGWPGVSVTQVFIGGGAAIAIAGALLLFSLPFGAEAFGMGDAKMIVLMGFVVGFPGIIPAVILGTIASGLVAGLLVLTRLRSIKDYMPHGPFLALGAVVILFAASSG